MSTFRYRSRGVSQETLRSLIELGVTVDQRSPEEYVDITLTDDSLKPDLDEVMGDFGYEFSATGPTFVADLYLTSPSGSIWGVTIGEDGVLYEISPTGVTLPLAVTGPTGPQGSPGVTGATGPQGSPGVTGATGPTGPQGSPGVTGATGPQGSPGVTGATGLNAFNLVPTFSSHNAGNETVLTGGYGQWQQPGQAVFIPTGGYFTVVGVTGANNLVLQDLHGNQPSGTIIGFSGMTGYVVPAGVPGATGATGAQGSPGVTGATGPQGSPGVTGATGPTGPDGVTGATGPQGSPGVTGATGPTGPQGSPGVTGATGPQGSPGPTGATGLNAFNIAPTYAQNNFSLYTVLTGAYGGWQQPGQAVFIPTGGYYSVVGATGASGLDLVLLDLANNQPSGTIIGYSGYTGYVVPAGVPGATGATGPTGPQGNQGSPGVTGATGPTGPQGSPGVTGATGPQGATGPTGPVYGAPVHWGAGSILQTTQVRYLYPGYDENNATIDDQFRWRVPRPGTLKNLYVMQNVPGDDAVGITYTLMVNGSATLLAATVNANVSTGQNTVNQIFVNAGDQVAIRVTKAAAILPAVQRVMVAVEFL